MMFVPFSMEEIRRKLKGHGYCSHCHLFFVAMGGYACTHCGAGNQNSVAYLYEQIAKGNVACISKTGLMKCSSTG